MPQNKLRDFCDGSLIRNNQLFLEDPSALQIQLYYDEVEFCNPLGSKAKKHKLGKICRESIGYTKVFIILGFLYYTLGNLDPILRSSLKSIQLLSVAKYDHLKAYGIEEMLRPVIEDVKKLESVSKHLCVPVLGVLTISFLG